MSGDGSRNCPDAGSCTIRFCLNWDYVNRLMDEMKALAIKTGVALYLRRFLNHPDASECLYDIRRDTVPAPDAYNREIIMEPTEYFRTLLAALRAGESDLFIEIILGHIHEGGSFCQDNRPQPQEAAP
ncbi:hypothetical protein [Fimbriiglobus ruber]|uniref:hypothetical protein n=1 Tax=Fimbriiglobus ruber TaxID=1908690 RepID=UPI00137AB719|nr:hypothetical protein [Fimbriiglobus ruber]